LSFPKNIYLKENAQKRLISSRGVLPTVAPVKLDYPPGSTHNPHRIERETRKSARHGERAREREGQERDRAKREKERDSQSEVDVVRRRAARSCRSTSKLPVTVSA
jgi:hypothetical protein